MVYYFFSHLEMLILVTAGLTKSDGTATEKVLPDTNNFKALFSSIVFRSYYSSRGLIEPITLVN